jgi:uncharacterized protein (DUF697 family)
MPDPSPFAEQPKVVVDVLTREEEARSIVRRYMFGNAAIGLVPIPIVDLVALTGVQIKMVQALAEHYGVDFKADVVKSSLISLVSGLGALTVGAGLALSAFKLLPIGGITAAVFSLPAASAALTYAVGRVYIMHFEAGGTLLDFDPQKMHAYFRDSYQTGLKVAKVESPTPAADPAEGKKGP